MAKAPRRSPTSTSFDEFNRTFEIFANQQATEIEAIRIILQAVLLRTTDAQAVADVQRDVLIALRRHVNEAPDQDARRRAEFVVVRAEAFFADILPLLTGTIPKPSAAH